LQPVEADGINMQHCKTSHRASLRRRTHQARDRRRIGDRLRIIWKHEDLNARDADQLEDQDEHYRSC
jgi:hypothetical protein